MVTSDEESESEPEPADAAPDSNHTDASVKYEVGVSSSIDQDDIITMMFDSYQEALAFFNGMVRDHPDAVRIDIESVLVDEDGNTDCVELLDVFGVYYTNAANWEAVVDARRGEWGLSGPAQVSLWLGHGVSLLLPPRLPFPLH